MPRATTSGPDRPARRAGSADERQLAQTLDDARKAWRHLTPRPRVHSDSSPPKWNRRGGEPDDGTTARGGGGRGATGGLPRTTSNSIITVATGVTFYCEDQENDHEAECHTRVFPASPSIKTMVLPAGGGSLSAERLHDSVAVRATRRDALLSALRRSGPACGGRGPTLKRWVVACGR